jgi:hypothetical protein
MKGIFKRTLWKEQILSLRGIATTLIKWSILINLRMINTPIISQLKSISTIQNCNLQDITRLKSVSKPKCCLETVSSMEMKITSME